MTQEKVIRKPSVAGQFYPLVPSELQQVVDHFLADAKVEFKPSPRILIVPHAGYIYSGQTAAYAYRTIRGRSFDSVIVLGVSHLAPFDGLFLYDGDFIETPLGKVEVDQEIVKKLTTFNHFISTDHSYHQQEHSLEVQVPFLQRAIPHDFKIVFGLFGSQDDSVIESVSESIKQILIANPNTLLVVSSDLSHYPAYDDAVIIDKKTINAILSLDQSLLTKTVNNLMGENIPNLDTCACGLSAILTGVRIAHDLEFASQLLKYSNSGDIEVGSRDRVVGYSAIVFGDGQISANDLSPKMTNDSSSDQTGKLTIEEQRAAIQLARQSIEKEFKPEVNLDKDYEEYKIFQDQRGAFVTLYQPDKNLRGCIGLIEPVKKLGDVIKKMALAAAFDDPRFDPLTEEELSNIIIEISVLTPPLQIDDIHQIELGKHGVIVRRGQNSGVFLPQVATETGWDLEQFMSHLCADKAGLAPDCWQNKEVEIYIFEAQVFGE